MGTVHYPIKDGHISSLYATFAVQTCGCKVDGTGTLQHPFHIIRCPLHATAPDLLAACKKADRELRAIVRTPGYVDKHLGSLAVLGWEIEAAVAKAKGE